MSPDQDSVDSVSDANAVTSAPLIVLEPHDNVATALRSLDAGERLTVNGNTVQPSEAIAVGHKVALVAIAEGGAVVKYGEVIGRATTSIDIGEHVHTHNVVSVRLPGPSVPSGAHVKTPLR